MSKLRLPVLFLALALWASAAPAETAPTPPRDLRELLATVDGELTLQVVLASGERVEGHAYRVENDTLQLATDAGMIARAPLAEILEISRRQQGAREGARWGATTGAVTLGTLGALFGLVISALGEEDSAAPVIGGGLLGIAVGGALGSGIGAGLGAMDRTWETIYPAGPPSRPRRVRVSLEAGQAFGRGLIEGGDGFSGRLSVLKRTSTYVEIGPMAEFHDVEGYQLVDTPYDTYAESASISLGAGFDVRVHSPATGVRPFFSSGFSWRAQDGLHLGSHAGGGLRWRTAGATELTLALRYQFLASRSHEASPDFWTINAGIVLGR
jgi:hypothetical protein